MRCSGAGGRGSLPLSNPLLFNTAAWSGCGVVVQAVEECAALGIADGEVAAARAESQAVHIAQRRAGGGPVGEDSAAGQVHQPQRVLLHARCHGQNLRQQMTCECIQVSL